MAVKQKSITEMHDRVGAVVLNTCVNYNDQHHLMLRQLIEEKIDLLAVVGVDCVTWEDAMIALCVELDAVTQEVPGAFCNTSSHPKGTLSNVVAIAEQWCANHGWPRETVRVITVYRDNEA